MWVARFEQIQQLAATLAIEAFVGLVEQASNTPWIGSNSAKLTNQRLDGAQWRIQLDAPPPGGDRGTIRSTSASQHVLRPSYSRL